MTAQARGAVQESRSRRQAPRRLNSRTHIQSSTRHAVTTAEEQVNNNTLQLKHVEDTDVRQEKSCTWTWRESRGNIEPGTLVSASIETKLSVSTEPMSHKKEKKNKKEKVKTKTKATNQHQDVPRSKWHDWKLTSPEPLIRNRLIWLCCSKHTQSHLPLVLLLMWLTCVSLSAFHCSQLCSKPESSPLKLQREVADVVALYELCLNSPEVQTGSKWELKLQTGF